MNNPLQWFIDNNQLNVLLDMLIETKERINTPDKWTKEAYARDKCGEPREWRIFNSDAVSWCLSGSLRITDLQWTTDYTRVRQITRFLCDYIPRDARNEGLTTLAGYNDDPKTTHEDIMWLLNNAITRVTNVRDYTARCKHKKRELV